MKDDRESVFVERWGLSVPVETTVRGTITLNHTVSAILLPTGANAETELKTVRQLPVGTNLLVCGSGFSPQTVKVQCDDGSLYFVFSEDLLISYLAQAVARESGNGVPEAEQPLQRALSTVS